MQRNIHTKIHITIIYIHLYSSNKKQHKLFTLRSVCQLLVERRRVYRNKKKSKDERRNSLFNPTGITNMSFVNFLQSQTPAKLLPRLFIVCAGITVPRAFLTYSLDHLFSRIPTYSLTYSLICLLAYSLTCLLAYR